ncbi:MAG TPA: trypsin-like serine protease [Acetobacteraceae bacterium]|nr:trypsin-like serine protease [Acetobacteraceae bacterium]
MDGNWPAAIILALAATLAPAYLPASAQVVAIRPSAPDIGTPQIIGGKQVGATEYPATWVFQAGRLGCTATAIGPETILTAAHCIADTPLGAVQTAAGSIDLTCTSYPGWTDRYPQTTSTYDIALCLDTDKKIPRIPLESDTTYERVSLVSDEIAPKTQVTLLGYGCTSDPNKNGYLYAGTAITTRKDAGAYVIVGAGEVQFCPGDSGGAVYREIGSYRREIAGIASRGDSTTSWITQTAASDVAHFLRRWSQHHAICGINAPKGMCHDWPASGCCGRVVPLDACRHRTRGADGVLQS